MRHLAENIWVGRYPLSFLGGDQGRVVTVIRLASGELLIHSTAPFSPEDAEAIASLGRPGWIVDAMLRHDTYAKEGRAAFPTLPYLAPEGFAGGLGVGTQPLLPPPQAWSGEIEVMLVEGMPQAREHVFLHVPSRTLIVADLLFNFDDAESRGWKGFVRRTLMGVRRHPDVARTLPAQIKDRAAFERSLRRILTWDFDRIVVGHGAVVETGGKEGFRTAFLAKGFLRS
ncbi:MAG TPA: hypothetical protein VIM58_05195 [Candidatus Methylacidiphilales bacterium]